jgi:hypothetical protein
METMTPTFGSVKPSEIRMTMQLLQVLKEHLLIYPICYPSYLDELVHNIWRQQFRNMRTHAGHVLNHVNPTDTLRAFTFQRNLTQQEALAGLDKAINQCRIEYDAAMNVE